MTLDRVAMPRCAADVLHRPTGARLLQAPAAASASSTTSSIRTVLELRELYGNAPSLRQRVHLAAEWWRLAFALRHADLLICAAREAARVL